MNEIRKIKLNNGIEMPMQGFGVFQIPEDECENVVLEAIKTGYRLFDTASSYKNEEALGRAIKKSGIPREEFFITTKAYIQEMGYENTKKAFERELEKLDMDYIDLYLIHMPFGDYYGSWRAMEELYVQGKTRAIGVSNFYNSRLIDLCYNVKIKPAINQIECHPLYQRKEEIEIMKELGIQIEGWAPFAEGLKGMFTNPALSEIAGKYNKSVAQIILRWNIQRGVIIIAKTTTKKYMEENINIWDFELSKEDMEKIAELDTNTPAMFDPLKPAEVRRVYDYLNNPVLTTLD